ncbi:MAG: hypothetical protein WAW37_16260 [Syntrophobacteraceae bacterium]
MRSINAKRTLLIILLVASFAVAGNAFAGQVVVQLQKVTGPTNINDAAGQVEYEGGNIKKDGTKVGQYAIERRRINGGTTGTFSTAMTTITLFFGQNTTTSAPDNITIQGAHGFGPGDFRGSVSAASSKYTWTVGADATYSVVTGSTTLKNLTISWTGSRSLTLP